MNDDKLTQRQIGGIIGAVVGGLLTGGLASAEDLRLMLRRMADDERFWRGVTGMLPRASAIIQTAIQEEAGRVEKKS